jgi:hypothetical protein
MTDDGLHFRPVSPPNRQSVTTRPICVECHHARVNDGRLLCDAGAYNWVDLIHGPRRTVPSCRQMREEGGQCAPEGRLFSRARWWNRLWVRVWSA